MIRTVANRIGLAVVTVGAALATVFVPAAAHAAESYFLLMGSFVSSVPGGW